jgi:uncharacterized protein with HEPN domain
MSRNSNTYLADVRTAAAKVLQITAGMDRDAFFRGRQDLSAVIHCLLIAGEAVKHIPDPIRDQMPEVEWRKIAEMRDWPAHVYFSINDDILWDVIETKVRELLAWLDYYGDREGTQSGICVRASFRIIDVCGKMNWPLGLGTS